MKKFKKPIKLHLGCGHKKLKGFINVDCVETEATDLIADITNLDLFEDNSVEAIVAIHVFEHFSWNDTDKILKEWKRVLKPNGWLVIEVPDSIKVFEAFINAPNDYERHNLQVYIYSDIRYLEGIHKYAWTPTSLRDKLLNNGFCKLYQNPDISSPLSIRIDGQKNKLL